MTQKTDEWFRISVVCKRTDHNLAGDVCAEISHRLRALGIEDSEVTFDIWGDEPMSRSQLKRLAAPGATNRPLDKTLPTR